MTAYFWDSSAVVKRYLTELGSAWVTSVILPSTGNSAIIAPITPVEISSALARRIREGTTESRTAKAAQLLFNRHQRREYTVIALSDVIVSSASSLTYQYPLRAYDAVQLATAIEINQRMISGGLSPVIFLSADKRLL